MNRSQLIELVRNRENSGVVFERDDIAPERLAGEMVGLLNLNGGHVLLGVEKDGAVTGLTRDSETVEEWVMKAARTHVQPATIPYWETIEWIAGASVGIVSFPANAPDKPYKAKRGSVWLTRVRVGSATRDATHEEERLYRKYGRIQYGLKPALGTGLDSFDFRRLRDYARGMGVRRPDFIPAGVTVLGRRPGLVMQDHSGDARSQRHRSGPCRGRSTLHHPAMEGCNGHFSFGVYDERFMMISYLRGIEEGYRYGD